MKRHFPTSLSFFFLTLGALHAGDAIPNGRLLLDIKAAADKMANTPTLLATYPLGQGILQSRRRDFHALAEVMQRYQPSLINPGDFREKTTLNVLEKQRAELVVTIYRSFLDALANMDQALGQLDNKWGEWNIEDGRILSSDKALIDFYNFSVLRDANQIAIIETCFECLERVKNEETNMETEKREFLLDESIRGNVDGATDQEFHIELTLGVTLGSINSCSRLLSAMNLPIASFAPKK